MSLNSTYEAAVEIREAITDAAKTITATRQEPQIRVRLQHTHTLKDGWRLSETTVEYSGATIDWAEVKEQLASAHVCGVHEARDRNTTEVPL